MSNVGKLIFFVSRVEMADSIGMYQTLPIVKIVSNSNSNSSGLRGGVLVITIEIVLSTSSNSNIISNSIV